MTTYYKSREAAAQVAETLEADDRVRATKLELEPYNGWVVVVFPALYHLKDLEEQGFEIDREGRRTRDPERKRPVPLAQTRTPGKTASQGASEGVSEGGAPAKGVTKQVWTIADAVVAEKGGIDRAEIMARCEAAGIHKSTAATQYSKWKRARGL